MANKNYVLIVFRSRQHALNFSDTLNQNGIRAALMPTPKELSLGCGSSVRIENGFWREAEIFIQNKNIEHNGIYSISQTRNSFDFRKIG